MRMGVLKQVKSVTYHAQRPASGFEQTKLERHRMAFFLGSEHYKSSEVAGLRYSPGCSHHYVFIGYATIGS